MKKLPFLFMAFCLLASFHLMAQSGSNNLSNLTGFTSIGLGMPIMVHVTQGDYKVEVSGISDIDSKMKIEVKDKTLRINSSKKYKNKNWSNKDKIVVRVQMPTIKGLSVAGSGDISVDDRFENLGDLDISIGGSGDVRMQGSAKMVAISVAGSGDVDAGDLKSAGCEISIAGSGDVVVGESKSLEISIAGSGDVSYKGEPQIKKSIAGSGDVNRI